MPPVEDRPSLLSLFSFASDSSSPRLTPKTPRGPVKPIEETQYEVVSSPRKRSKSPKSKSKSEKRSHAAAASSSPADQPTVASTDSPTQHPSTPPTPAGPVEPVSVQTDPDLDDLLDFLKFAHTPANPYNGTIEFKLKYPNESQSSVFVRVHPTNGVSIFYDKPSDGVVSCVATMDRSVFFNVYWGKLHPRKAVLSGRVSVSNWAYMELYHFGCAFDLTGAKWTAYYAWKNVRPPATPSASEFLNCDDATQSENPASATTTVMQTPEAPSIEQDQTEEPDTEAAALLVSPVPDILSAFERIRDALLFSGPTVEYDTLFPPNFTPQPIRLRLRQDTPIHNLIQQLDTHIDSASAIRQAQAQFECPFLDDSLPFSKLSTMRAECGASDSLRARSVVRMLRNPSSWVPRLVAESRSKYDGFVRQMKRTDRETLPVECWPSS